MLSQMMRSSRGLLLIGAVLAIAAFALVVVLLNKNNSTTANTTTTNTIASIGTSPTVPVDTATPLATSTPAVVYILANKDVPANTRLGNSAEVSSYFKDITPPSGSAIPADAVPGIAIMESKVVTGTIFLGYIDIVNPIKKGKLLLNGDYRILPFSPPNSLSYQVDPGRVAESIIVPSLAADYGAIMTGDYVDVLLTIHQHEVDSLTANPPASSGPNTGPLETQQLISNARVVASFPISSTYTLQLPLQDALLMKYVKDTGGLVDMVLLSAQDVRGQAAQPQTNAVVPETFLTPLPQPTPGRGTPQPAPLATQVGGVANAFLHYPTPVPTPIPPKP